MIINTISNREPNSESTDSYQNYTNGYNVNNYQKGVN